MVDPAQSHHHLCRNRFDPYALDVAASASDRRTDRRCRDRRGRAGAAIVHLHARNPQDGRPDQSPEAFAPFLKVIKQRSNVVVNITTGGAPTMTPEEHVRPAATFKPEVASLNMGTMNFGLYPMIPRYKGKFKHAWEEQYLEGSRKSMFKNTLADIEYILTPLLGKQHPLEIECYDIGHLYTLRHFVDRGVVKPPLFAQWVFGILGGIGTHPEDIIMMKRTADRLLGDNYHWSVLGVGGNQMRVRLWQRPWEATCRSAWKTHYGSTPGGSPSRMHSRSHRCAISSKASASRSRPPTRRGRFSLKGGDRVNF